MSLVITKDGNAAKPYTIEGYVKSVSEIADLPTDYREGSIVCAVDDCSLWILINKEWIEFGETSSD
jgi:hypothetical protein